MLLMMYLWCRFNLLLNWLWVVQLVAIEAIQISMVSLMYSDLSSFVYLLHAFHFYDPALFLQCHHFLYSCVYNAGLNHLIIKPCCQQAPHNVPHQPQPIVLQPIPISIPDPHQGPGNRNASIQGSPGCGGEPATDVNHKGYVEVPW